MKKFMTVLVVLAMCFAPAANAYFTEEGSDVGPTGIVFEGATDDAYETTLAVTDPTGSDKTITFPNSSQTVGTATSIQNDLILSEDFADEDWGDMSVSTNSVTLDADVVAAAEMADADHGDISWTSGVASIDAGVVDTTELAANAVDATILQDVVGASSANQACNTTCGIAGCYMGFDTGTSVFVSCADATADTCSCDGATS